jgi:hypothetical protein
MQASITSRRINVGAFLITLAVTITAMLLVAATGYLAGSQTLRPSSPNVVLQAPSSQQPDAVCTRFGGPGC